MERGLFRALVATLFISLLLVVTVPKHYVHACDHEHAGGGPVGPDTHTAFVSSDHHCAICDLVIPSYTPTAANSMVFRPMVLMCLELVSPPVVVLGCAERLADRGPPVLS